MERNKDWTDVMRSALRDAELTPPAGGWERLERDLGASAPRISVFRRYWPRIAAAAAAVLVFVGGGRFLLHEDRHTGNEGFVIATATDSGSSAADNHALPDGETPAGDAFQTLIPSREAVEAERLPGESAASFRAAQTQRLPQALMADNGAGRGAQHAGTAASVAGAEAQTAGNTTPTGFRDMGVSNAQSGPDEVGDASGPAERPAASIGGTQDGSPEAKERGNARVADEGPDARTSAAVRSARRATAFGDEEFVAYRAPRKKASFGLFAGGGVTGSGTENGPGGVRLSDIAVGNTDGVMAQLKYDYYDNSFRHHQPLSFGLSVRKEFPYGLSLESGVIYTLLWSDVRIQSGSEDISQKLHFIGVPLRVNWQFYQTGRFSFYIGAGGMLEKCVAAKFGSRSVDEPRVQWSVVGAAGAQYMLGNHIGLYFEPEASYYFTETHLRTTRTDTPLSLSLRLGVRLAF